MHWKPLKCCTFPRIEVIDKSIEWEEIACDCKIHCMPKLAMKIELETKAMNTIAPVKKKFTLEFRNKFFMLGPLKSKTPGVWGRKVAAFEPKKKQKILSVILKVA